MGKHHLMQSGNRLGRRFEVSKPVTFCDRQRCPAVLICLIPNLDLGAVVDKKLHDLGEVSVSGAVHGGFAVFVDRINITAKLQCQPYSLEHFGLGAGCFFRSSYANSGCGHQRSAIFRIWQERVGPQLYE